MNKLDEIKSWLEKIKAGGYEKDTIAFGDTAWQAVEYCGELVGMIAKLQAQVDKLENNNVRLRQDRYDALSVYSKDGLLSSEWVLRAGKAEREAKELRAQVVQLAKANSDELVELRFREKQSIKLQAKKNKRIAELEDQIFHYQAAIKGGES